MIPFPGMKMCVDIGINGNESIALGKRCMDRVRDFIMPQILLDLCSNIYIYGADNVVHVYH